MEMALGTKSVRLALSIWRGGARLAILFLNGAKRLRWLKYHPPPPPVDTANNTSRRGVRYAAPKTIRRIRLFLVAPFNPIVRAPGKKAEALEA